MKNYKGWLSLFIVLIVQVSFAQKAFDFSEEAVIERLRQDVNTLASDEMEGREAGTPGERLAAEYIKQRMEEIGLQPMFDDSFLQEFTFPGQWIITPGNFMSVAGRLFYPGESYNPLPVSGDATAESTAIYAGRGMNGFMGINDYQDLGNIKGKIFVIEYFLPQHIENENDLSQVEIINMKLEAAIEHGASGVVFVNTFSERENPRIRLRGNQPRQAIPVVFAAQEIAGMLTEDPEVIVSISTQLEREIFSAVNVAGYLDNNAPTTVVIGGHYDHLGWGGSGSRSPGEAAIHPGADDNASGIAGVLEAARYLSNSTLTNNNYVFIAFSAEEKGLLGSRYFSESDAYDMDKINYMFNFDMIGRLEEGNISLIGTGTSPAWDGLIDELAPEHFNIRKSPGGMGGSDHSAFYMKDIPVIFFFTGIHDDYHRPGDTPDKVNFQGASQILAFSLQMIERIDKNDEPLEFSSTPMPERRQRRSDGVTLGIMPDHAYDGQGMRVQAVIEDRPAQKAGMQDGDIIIRIENIDVQEIYSYMGALENLRKGQTVKVTVMRGEEKVIIDVVL